MFTLKRSRQFVALTLGCLLSGAALAGTISTFAGSGTNGHQDGALSVAQFSAPMALALDGVSSTLYLSDSHSIRSIQNGVVTTLAGDGTTAVFNLPSDLALDNVGNLYIIDQNNQSLKRLELATGLVTVVLDGTQLTDPQGVTVDDTGMVYVADAGANQILKVDVSVTPATSTVLALDAAATALNSPQGLAINGTKLFVAEPLAQRVRVIDLSAAPATLFTVAGGTGKTFYNFANPGITGAQANLKTPTDLVLDSAGNLYISDVGHNRVLKWDVATQLVTVVAGVGSSLGVGGFSGDGGQGRLAEIDLPVGLAVDSAGVLYFADSNNQRVRSVANDMMAVPVTTTTTTAPTTTGNAATGSSATGQTLYVASCASCHGADPVTNTLKVANGTSAGIITTQHAFVGAADALNLAAYISSRVGTATTPVTGTTTTTPATGTSTTGSSANGQVLYAAGCANCHGGDPINNGLNVANGISALVITSTHSFVVSADAVDLAAYISSRVGTATTPVTGTSSGGAALYASKCAGCHGADPINDRQDIASGTSASEISKQHGTQYSTSAESTQIASYISSRVLSSGGSAVDSVSSASGDDDDDDEGFGGSTAPMLLLMLLGAAVLRRQFVA
ncbi:MAG: hypothetical protein Q9O24_08445 [Gammaproteobacteria bacterium]|nr:hypothetical protein [Gammaproteobacteria bacterium]